MERELALGFDKKDVIEAKEVSTLQELITIVELFIARAGNIDPDLVYVEDGTGANPTLRLIENTLTDGSKTYDVRIS